MTGQPSPTAPRTVGIVLFDDVEVLDACGPFEVFSIAARPGEDSADAPLFSVLMLAEGPGLVRAAGGLLIQPHATLADAPPLDLVLVPGGTGTRRQQRNPLLVDWVRQRAAAAELTLSVCTGAFVLAAAGLLAGRRATTHWATTDGLAAEHPAVDVRTDARWVDEGPLVTAAGISAGIDMALHVVRRLHGEETARWTARMMEYDWDQGLGIGRTSGGGLTDCHASQRPSP